MSDHALMISLNELRKRDKMQACRACYPFFATGLLLSIIKSLLVLFDLIPYVPVINC